MKRICSGLGSLNTCEKRSQCVNYTHWLDDPRSEFNICASSGQPFKYYAPRGAQIILPAAQMQGDLFGDAA